MSERCILFGNRRRLVTPANNMYAYVPFYNKLCVYERERVLLIIYKTNYAKRKEIKMSLVGVVSGCGFH